MHVVDLPQELKAGLEACTTVSDRIRLLDRAGYARADIARILNKRYQHVRNVLEADAQRRRNSARPEPPAPDATGSGGVFRLQVAPDGALRLSTEIMEALGIPRGGTLAARLEDGELRLAEPVVALRKVQAQLAPLRARLQQEGVSVVDELIAERRAEAARDDGEASEGGR